MLRTLRWGIVGLLLVAAAGVSRGQPVETQYPRVWYVCFDPVLKTVPGAPRLSTYRGWFDPRTQYPSYLLHMKEATHFIVQERFTNFLHVDFFPVKADGFQYTEAQYLAGNWHQPDGVDYQTIVRDYDLARKVDRGEIDEAKIGGAPYFGYYESRFAGRGGYWCNSPPMQQVASSRLFVLMGWNYERTVSLHATGHRAESILTHVYNGWDVNGDRTIWDRFGWNVGQTTISETYGVGSAHLPANGDDHYDYGNPQSVLSYAPDWLSNFPNLQGATAFVSRDDWGGGNYELNYFKWWYQHMPHVAGTNSHDGYVRLNNWWEYIFNFNAHTESGGDHPRGGVVPPGEPYGEPVRQVTANARDEWAPVANDAGVLAWYGHDGNDFEIHTDLRDGNGPRRITNNAFSDEAVRINNAGQLVWQAFNGRNYEIFTANVDGTNLVQITNSGFNNWHPDINDAGRIVWDGWDGDDYEVFSANVDGSDLVQITDRTAASGLPLDDVWPRINDHGRIVWMGYDGNDFEIYSASADGTDPVQVTSNFYKDEFPQLNNQGYAVWHTWHTNSNAEIYSAPAAGGAVPLQLTNNTTEDWWPQINDNNIVVWMYRGAQDWEVMMRSALGGMAYSITADAKHDQYPRIDAAGQIAWQGFDGQDWEIYTYVDGAVYQVTDNDYDDQWPQFGGAGLITWHAEAAGGSGGPTTEVFFVGAPSDTVPPQLVRAVALSQTEVRVEFSEPVDPNTAEDAANYALTPEVAVLSATLQGDQRTVRLTTAPLAENTTYTLAVSGVVDLADPPNEIPPGAAVQFTVVLWERVSDGLVVLYNFREGEGATVTDVAGVGDPLNLTISSPADVTWTETGLRLDAPTRIQSAGAATKVYDACTAADALTIEAWIVPAAAQQAGPARIVSMSVNTTSRNFTLGQGEAGGEAAALYTVQVRTTETTSNGEPSISSPEGTAAPTLTHVLYTRDAGGMARLYVDGTQAASSLIGGDFSTWNGGYRLLLGNELLAARPWLGEYRLVAIYERALDPNEVSQNFLAGLGEAPPSGCPGDYDCDGDRDFFDIDFLLAALGGEAAWRNKYEQVFGGAPSCDFLTSADVNGDGAVDFFDIDAFLASLGQACP